MLERRRAAAILALTAGAALTRLEGSARATQPGTTARAAPESDEDLPPPREDGPAQRGPQPPPWRPYNLYSLLSPEALTAELEARHAMPGTFEEKVERVTRGLVAAPYLLSPLGEGMAPDPDPRFRLDAFDCTTLVETALALLACDDLGEVQARLDRIRYRGPALAFTERRHLMTAQWIPELIAAGLLVDVTREVGGSDTARLSVALDPARWRARRVARALALPAEAIPVGEFGLDYLPLKAALVRLDSLPEATVLNVVRAEAPGAPEVVTHQGLLVRHPGDRTLYIRHASPVAKRVLDEPLERKLGRYLVPRRWPIIGINLLRIVPTRAGTGAPR